MLTTVHEAHSVAVEDAGSKSSSLRSAVLGPKNVLHAQEMNSKYFLPAQSIISDMRDAAYFMYHCVLLLVIINGCRSHGVCGCIHKPLLSTNS